MKKYKYYFIILAIYFVSCRKETVLDIPHSEEKIVVNSILVADENIKIYVSKSTYILDTEKKIIQDAEVRIFVNNEFLTILEHDSAGIYKSSDIKAEIGKKYSIEVMVKGFDKLTAKTYVPYPVLLDSINVNRFVGKNENARDLSKLNIYFTDTTKSSAYYQYEGSIDIDSIISIFEEPDYLYNHNFYVNDGVFSYNPIILEEGDKKSRVFSNKLFTQDNVILDIMFIDPLSFFSEDSKVSYKLKAHILSISESLYKYQKSYKHYEEMSDNIFGVNEPPQLYSNINNGYGIFAALSCSDIDSTKILDY